MHDPILQSGLESLARESAASRKTTGARTGRLLVTSNRAPIRVIRGDGGERIEPTVGGLSATFLRLLERHGGLWIAWSGGAQVGGRFEIPAEDPRFLILFCALGARDISQYYYGMCCRGLWPLMHFMIPNCRFESRHWASYLSVNRAFAAIAAAEASAGDLLWVQDFHLALVPGMFRAERRGVPIGLFWHVPFPPEQLLRVFPWCREFLRGMLGADLIGFHTRAYARHFLNSCESILGLEVDRVAGVVKMGARPVRVGAFPLGISADYFGELAASASVRQQAQSLRLMLRSPLLLLGVDRLDYTKGILERLLGFERFLEDNPGYHRRVTFVQIAVPSRTTVADYAALKRGLDELVGRIIGRFSREGWTPVRYLYTQFGTEELVAYYQAADVAVLTPLRDGMNLVAKEYVASHPDDDAVLVLSEFAGAAEELRDALLVNPYDIEAIARGIKEALEMSAEERARRLRAMRAQVHRNDLENWSSLFLGTLASHGALAARFDLGSAPG